MVTKEEIIRIIESEEEIILDDDMELMGKVVWDDKFGFIAQRIIELIKGKLN